jgi:N-acetylglutamate synthase-like GNAT family acetyltransferase
MQLNFEHLSPRSVGPQKRSGLTALACRSLRQLASEAYDPSAIEGLIARSRQAVKDAARTHRLDRNGETVAFGSWHSLDLERAEITALYVLPSQARSGLGSLLLYKAECEAVGCGHREVAVEATLNSMPFFTKAGYLPTKVTTRDAGTSRPLVTVRMIKSFGPGTWSKYAFTSSQKPAAVH